MTSQTKTARMPLILLVDDVEDNRAVYAMFLTYSGFRVAEAVDGHEALTKAVELRPDLIVMDLSIPGIDGWEATRRLKRDEHTWHIPVVALTGHALTGSSAAALNAGCDGFLAKPCLPEDLVIEIRRMLDMAEPKTQKRR